MSHPILAITSGEPAGVGPDLCAALPRRDWPARLVVLGDRALIAARVHAVEPSVEVIDYQPGGSARPGAIEVLHVPLAVPAVPGKLDAANGRYVLDILDRAIQVHGALGLTDDLPLAWFYRQERAARVYDGPDEVHKAALARRILKKHGLSLAGEG